MEEAKKTWEIDTRESTKKLEEAKTKWTEEAKVTTGDDTATADFSNFDEAVAEYGKTRANKYDETTAADAGADGSQTASTDGDSTSGDTTSAAGAN